MNRFGIQESYLKMLIAIFSAHHQVREVVVYGSRAKGNYTARSDIDMVICNSQIDRHVLGKILLDINDSNFPYTVDLQILENIKNISLLAHISRVGQTFYKKEN
jgi:predicted nucleotidyltransferase